MIMFPAAMPPWQAFRVQRLRTPNGNKIN